MKKENIILIIEIILLVLMLGIYAFYVYYYYYIDNNNSLENVSLIMQDSVNNEIKNENNDIKCPICEENKNIFVEIKGEVLKPGVYETSNKNIVNDVINLAGGLTKSAYTDNINMSHKLENEMVIYVYSKGKWDELHKEEVIQEVVQEECVCEKVEISSCIENGESIIVSENKEEKNNDINNIADEKDNLININLASVDQLKTLDGIGDAKAKKIIEYRQENGNFNSIEDIMNVSGISESLYAKIKDNITV